MGIRGMTVELSRLIRSALREAYGPSGRFVLITTLDGPDGETEVTICTDREHLDHEGMLRVAVDSLSDQEAAGRIVLDDDGDPTFH